MTARNLHAAPSFPSLPCVANHAGLFSIGCYVGGGEARLTYLDAFEGLDMLCFERFKVDAFSRGGFPLRAETRDGSLSIE